MIQAAESVVNGGPSFHEEGSSPLSPSFGSCPRIARPSLPGPRAFGRLHGGKCTALLHSVSPASGAARCRTRRLAIPPAPSTRPSSSIITHSNRVSSNQSLRCRETEFSGQSTFRHFAFGRVGRFRTHVNNQRLSVKVRQLSAFEAQRGIFKRVAPLPVHLSAAMTSICRVEVSLDHASINTH